jgi:lysine-N-methylase
MAEKMAQRSGRDLPRAHYVRLVEEWQEFLRSEDQSPPAALARLYDLTDEVDEALPKTKRPDNQEFEEALTKARAVATTSLERGRLSFGGRMLVAHLLGGICYPSRVMLAHRLKRVTWSERIGSWMNRLSWLFGWGKVRLLFVDVPVRMRRAHKVKPFLGADLGRLVSDYLLEILDRRQGMAKQTYLSRVVVDLALMTALISRYARAAASADDGVVQEKHVREGIGVAELLFSHQGDSGQSTVLHQLRLVFMSNRKDFRRLLAAEL